MHVKNKKNTNVTCRPAAVTRLGLLSKAKNLKQQFKSKDLKYMTTKKHATNTVLMTTNVQQH